MNGLAPRTSDRVAFRHLSPARNITRTFHVAHIEMNEVASTGLIAGVPQIPVRFHAPTKSGGSSGTNLRFYRMATAFSTDCAQTRWAVRIKARVGVAMWRVDLHADAVDHLLSNRREPHGELTDQETAWIMQALRRKALAIWQYGGGEISLNASELASVAMSGTKASQRDGRFDVVEYAWMRTEVDPKTE